jgi:hypothetical protein
MTSLRDGRLSSSNGPSSSTVSVIYSASPSLLISIFSLLILLNFAHFFFSWNAPSLFSSLSESALKDPTLGNHSLEISSTVSFLRPEHRFIAIECSLLRRRVPSKNSNSLISVRSKVVFRRNSKVIEKSVLAPASVRIDFLKGNPTSSSFRVLNRGIADFDSVWVHLSLNGSFNRIEGYKCNWFFMNPVAGRYIRVTRALVSLLPLFMLGMMTVAVRIELKTFTELFCLLLGIAGVFASNPASVILGESDGVADHVALAVYIALFRLFCLAQLDMVRLDGVSPDPILFLASGGFLSFFVMVVASASLERASVPFIPTLFSEQLLRWLDCCYFGVIVVLVRLAALTSPGIAWRRILMCAGFAAADLAAGLPSLGPVKTSSTVFPAILRATVPVSCGTCALFLLSPHSTRHYEPITSLDGGKEGLGVDAESDGAAETSFEDLVNKTPSDEDHQADR